MLVKAWGRFPRRSYPITAVSSQTLLARWVFLSAAYGVGSFAPSIALCSTPDAGKDVCLRGLVVNILNYASLSMRGLCRKMIIIDINHVPLGEDSTDRAQERREQMLSGVINEFMRQREDMFAQQNVFVGAYYKFQFY